MKKVKQVIDFVIEALEVNISTIVMIVVFVGFVTNIFLRYILLYSIPQIDEIIVIGFLWLALFGSSNGTKKNRHVAFTMIYDAISPKSKAVYDIISKSIMIILLGILVYPAWDIINFFDMRRTPTLRLSFKWIFMPYMFFLVCTLYHLINGLVKDIKHVRNVFKGTAEETTESAPSLDKEI